MLNALEPRQTVKVCATLFTSNVIEDKITVRLATSDGTGMYFCQLCDKTNKLKHIAAKRDFDYMEVSIDLVFTTGSSNGATQCINVAIIDSPTIEEDETFTVTLTTSEPIIELGNHMTTVTIKNIDCKYD